MAEQQERVDVNTEQNAAGNPHINPSDYPNHQAWTQYWQYYYSYYMYYHTAYYYMALSQPNSTAFPGSSTPVTQPASTFMVSGPQQNQADLRQRFPNGGLVGVVDFRQRNRPEERYEYKVASLGKRIFAEFIDFVFLYFLKYSLFLLYYKDPDKLNSQFQYILVIDDNTSLKDIENVLIQALVYRVIVFLYETIFVAMPFPCKTGGATLGKYMMNITVVSYRDLTPIEGQNLRRFIGNASHRLSIWQSSARAILKNFMITFFFPIIFTTMFLQNYRTPYDFVASSVVVDAHPKRVTQQN